MDSNMRSHIVHLLETYRDRAKQIVLLHYELEHAPSVSADDVIGAMSFGHSDGTTRSKGHISNKTLYIALNYQEQTDKLNSESKTDLINRLVVLEHEQDRLVYYVSLLDKRQAGVVRRFYFDTCSLEEIAAEIGVSLRTVCKIKSRAIDSLADMYSLCAVPTKMQEGQV